MRSGATKFDSFAYENINVRSYGDTAVAIATVKAKGVVSGKPRTSDMIATLVLHKGADGWKVVSGQATAVAAAATSTASNTANTAANKPANSASNTAANK
jgi:ketosteroid isomerase-like protein